MPTLELLHLKQLLQQINMQKNKMINNAPHGTAIVSEEQIANAVRFQRSFYSPLHSGISLTTEKPLIKWVNDIVLNDKKICGILTEAVTHFKSGAVPNVIVGIGINFNTKTEQFDKELQDIASSLFTDKAPTITKNQLIAEILNNLVDITKDCVNRAFLQEYKALSCVLGKSISFCKNNEWYHAKAIDIDENGALIVENDSGLRQKLLSEEVSIKRK